MTNFKEDTDRCQLSRIMTEILLFRLMGIMNSILVSTDFSPASWKAFQVAIELQKKYGSNMCLFHVFPNDNQYTVNLMTRMTTLKKNMERLANDMVDSKEIEIETVVVSGNVSDELEGFASDNNFDLVVMGVNGNGEDNRPGSHTIKLLEKSTVPVLVVPNESASNA